MQQREREREQQHIQAAGSELPPRKISSDSLSIFCVRHGQSTANAGASTTDPATIPLSETGHSQARQWSESLERPPELIVVSPFLRARQTAAPLQGRFPNVPMEIWPIQEFTYLSPVKSAGTTAAQRRPRVDAYWAGGDINFEDGDGAESFAMFMARVNVARNKLEALQPIGIQSVVCVGHGQFWQALRAVIQGSIVEINSEAMRHFKHLEENEAMANASGFSACWTGGIWGPSV